MCEFVVVVVVVAVRMLLLLFSVLLHLIYVFPFFDRVLFFLFVNVRNGMVAIGYCEGFWLDPRLCRCRVWSGRARVRGFRFP